MRVLVAGATGILRPAVVDLTAAGHQVVALARDIDALARLAGPSVAPAPVDASAPEALTAALAAVGPLDAALVYDPVLSGRPESWTSIRAAVHGRIVRILTSAAADTGTPEFSVADLAPGDADVVRLVLGWAGSGANSRWHTPLEISDAAGSALRSGREAVLGRVRPWPDRPV